MSVTSTTRKAGPYPNSSNSSTTDFPFAFKVFNAADLLVVQTDNSPTPADTTLTLNTHYTVSLNPNQDSNPGGTVTLLTALPSGYLLTLGSQVAESQGTTLTNTGGFYPTVINNALDYLTILIQQVSEKLSRALVMPFSTNASGQLPPVSPGSLLGWKADGTGIDNIGATGVGAGGIVSTNMAAGATGDALSSDTQAATTKATPADADEMPLFDSAATPAFTLKSLTWANLKATLFSSPIFTGNPQVPDQVQGSNNSYAANTKYVDTASAAYASVAISIDTTLLASYKGKRISCSGSITLTLDAAANLGAAWWVFIENAGAGVVTLSTGGSLNLMEVGGPVTPGSSISIPDAGTGTILYNNSAVMVFCDGANFSVTPVAIPHGSQEFTASGTWTAPNGVTTVWLSGITPGAGGGAGATGANGTNSGGGGGGGGSAGTPFNRVAVNVVPGAQYAVTMTPGTGGVANGGSGSTGSMSFGTLFSLTSGGAGNGGSRGSGTGGAGGAGGTGGGTGGAGSTGTGSAGNPGENIAPFAGGAGGTAGAMGGGGGGGAASTEADGGAGGYSYSTYLGYPGTTPTGAGAGGGGGGAGASYNNGNYNAGNGGNGGPGRLVVEW